ncbi:MAG: DNA-directed RNA polymerase subunit alpha C-terminal domain-containing protein [Nanoarchaeota archaeon]|nr:DNA-directed RNA polymerase subunit alpha C-terminal domain-containing protein [Nanoarchaeota archaeon]
MMESKYNFGEGKITNLENGLVYIERPSHRKYNDWNVTVINFLQSVREASVVILEKAVLKEHKEILINYISYIHTKGLLKTLQKEMTSDGEQMVIYNTAGLVSRIYNSLNVLDILEDEKDFYKKINSLGLSYRAERVLRVNDIVYIGDLVGKTKEQLMSLASCGRITVNEITDVLNCCFDGNIYLGMPTKSYSRAEANLKN